MVILDSRPFCSTSTMASSIATCSILFPKKTKPVNDDDAQLQMELLVDMGRRAMDYVMSDVIGEILAPNAAYYTRQRTVVLQALAQLAHAFPARMQQSYNVKFGQIISTLIEQNLQHLVDAGSSGGGSGGLVPSTPAATDTASSKADHDSTAKYVTQLCAALQCWPYIRAAATQQHIAALCCWLLLYDDRHIQAQLSLCLERYVLLDLNHHFLPVMHTLLDLLAHEYVDLEAQIVIKILNLITLLCNGLVEHITTQNNNSQSHANDGQPPFQVTLTAWLALREHVEAAIMLRLLACEAWQRMEILRTLVAFERPQMRALELGMSMSSANAIPGGPNATGGAGTARTPEFLADYLVPGGEVSASNDAFYKPVRACPQLRSAQHGCSCFVHCADGLANTCSVSSDMQLHDVMVHHYAQFSGLLHYVFSHTFHRVTLLAQLNDGQLSASFQSDDWFVALRTQLMAAWLCVRPTSAIGDGEQQAHFGSVTSPQRKSATMPTIADMDRSCQATRGRLSSWQSKVNENLYFYEQFVHYIQTQHANNAESFIIREVLVRDCAISLHTANYADFIKYVRKIQLDEREAASNTALAAPKKGRRAVDVKSCYYFHEYTLGLLAHLYQHYPASAYQSSAAPFMNQTLSDLLEKFVSCKDELNQYSVVTRGYIAHLIARFLQYHNVHSSDDNDASAAAAASSSAPSEHGSSASFNRAEVLNHRAVYFQLLLACTVGTQEIYHSANSSSTPSGVDLYTHILHGLLQFIQLAPMHEKALEKTLLGFLEQVLAARRLPSSLYQATLSCLCALLTINPAYVDDFMRRSCAEAHAQHHGHAHAHSTTQAPTATAAAQQGSMRSSLLLSADARHLVHRDAAHSPAHSIARAYVHALRISMGSAALQAQDAHLDARCMALFLLHLTSIDDDTRQLAVQACLRLDRLLTQAHQPASPDNGLGSGHSSAAHALVGEISHPSPLLYIETAFNYSAFFVSYHTYSSLSTFFLPLMAQAVAMCAHLSETNKEILLQLILPWLEECVLFIVHTQDVAQQAAVTTQLIQHLIDLTRLCYGTRMLYNSVKKCWLYVCGHARMTNDVMQIIMEYVTQQYCALLVETAPSDVLNAPSAPAAAHSEAAQPSAAAAAAATAGGDGAAAASSNADSASTAPSAPPQTPPAPSQQPPQPSPHGRHASDASKGPAAALATYHQANTEKQLLKLIVMHMLRSTHHSDVFMYLFLHLRHYNDDVSHGGCPLDIDEFVQWSAARNVKQESLTVLERACFELLNDVVYEYREMRELKMAVPLLLHMIYTFYPSTEESHEMLNYILFALQIHTQFDTSADAHISLTQLISVLRSSYPDIHAAWSQTAFIWALHSCDPHISTRSLQIYAELDYDNFYFGDTQQSILLRLIFLCIHCLRALELEKLACIVRVMTGDTVVPYDKNGWCALLCIAWVFCGFQTIAYFQMGLSLFHSLFTSAVRIEEQRKWILSMGRFLCGPGQAIDDAIVDVLQKGLLSKITIQNTMILLSGLSEIYAYKTLNGRNKVLCLMLIGNITMRLDEALLISQGSTLKEGDVLAAMNDCIHLCSLLFQYVKSESTGQAQLKALANLFKELAQAYARLLPAENTKAVSSSDSPGQAAADSEVDASSLAAHRKIVNEDLSQLIKTMDNEQSGGGGGTATGSSNPFAADAADASSSSSTPAGVIQAAPALSTQFFTIFVKYFDSSDDFTFLLNFFQQMLPHGSPEFRHSLLIMLMDVLTLSPHAVPKSSYAFFAEQLTQISMSKANQAEQALVERLIKVLVERGSGDEELARATDLFNFIRPKPKRAPISLAGQYLTIQSTPPDLHTQLTLSLQRINLEEYAFVELREMRTKERPLSRDMQRDISARRRHWRHLTLPSLASPSASAIANSSSSNNENKSASASAAPSHVRHLHAASSSTVVPPLSSVSSAVSRTFSPNHGNPFGPPVGASSTW